MSSLGEAIGEEYVARTFTPAAKARAKAIVDNMVVGAARPDSASSIG